MAEHDQAEMMKKREEEARKRIGEEKARREQQMASSREASAGVKPTPTQEENDLAASGVPVELEPDGSPEQPTRPPPPPEGAATKTRQVEADKNRPGYSTRATEAQPKQGT